MHTNANIFFLRENIRTASFYQNISQCKMSLSWILQLRTSHLQFTHYRNGISAMLITYCIHSWSFKYPLSTLARESFSVSTNYRIIFVVRINQNKITKALKWSIFGCKFCIITQLLMWRIVIFIALKWMRISEA